MKTGFVVPGFISCCSVCKFHETHSAYILTGKRVGGLYGPEIVVACFKSLIYIIIKIKLKNLISCDFFITVHVFTSFFTRESSIGSKCTSVL